MKVVIEWPQSSNTVEVQCLLGNEVRVLGILFEVTGATEPDAISIEYQLNGSSGALFFNPTTGNLSAGCSRVSFGIGMIPNGPLQSVVNTATGIVTHQDLGTSNGALPDVWFDQPVRLITNMEGTAAKTQGRVLYETRKKRVDGPA